MRLPEPYTFFIDRSLGTRDVPDALRGVLGENEGLHIHDDLFAQDAPDDTWLSHVGTSKWIAFSKDDAIRRNPALIRALLIARTAIFIFGSANVRGVVIGQAFARALPRIRKAVRRFEPAIIGRVTQAGEVSVLWASGAKLPHAIVIR